jgi:CBS domain-containing protein
MTVKELMKTDVATCAPDSDLGAVIKTMRDRDCGFLPVVDSHGIVVGVVTDRDVCMAAGTAHRPLRPRLRQGDHVPSSVLLFRRRERQDGTRDDGETPHQSLAGLEQERTLAGRLVD